MKEETKIINSGWNRFWIRMRTHIGRRKLYFEKNRGFSLVELIIVIAIMAILAAAIAPAVIRYINKARQADDIAAADTIGTTINAAMTESEAVYDWINYRVSQERNGKYIIIGFTGYGNGINFYLAGPAGNNELYQKAIPEFEEAFASLLNEDRTSKIPIKFHQKNCLDQWIIAVDRTYKLYVFVRGHLSAGSSWWIGDDNRVNGSQHGRLYCYQLWPDVDPKYHELSTPSKVKED